MNNKANLPRETYSKILTTTDDTQVCKAPWMNSKNGTLRWKKLAITNTNAGVATINFWDQDIDSATPGSYGSTSAPLFVRKVAATSSIEIPEDSLPNQQFIAGIAADTDVTNVHITVEVEIEIL